VGVRPTPRLGANFVAPTEAIGPRPGRLGTAGLPVPLVRARPEDVAAGVPDDNLVKKGALELRILEGLKGSRRRPTWPVHAPLAVLEVQRPHAGAPELVEPGPGVSVGGVRHVLLVQWHVRLIDGQELEHLGVNGQSPHRGRGV
jgi:hypothetical protein